MPLPSPQPCHLGHTTTSQMVAWKAPSDVHRAKPTHCPTKTPEDLFFLFATTTHTMSCECTSARLSLLSSRRGNPTEANSELSSSRSLSARRPQRNITPSFSRKWASSLDSFGTGRSRSARAASAPEETPSSAPEYAPALGASAPGTRSTRSFPARSSSCARGTGGASPPVAEGAGSELLSAEPRYFEGDRGTARQGPTREPRPSCRLAPERTPKCGVARGDSTRAAALACMPPCVSLSPTPVEATLFVLRTKSRARIRSQSDLRRVPG